MRAAQARGYNDTVDFPVRLVKPIILEATERAMALRIFDRIGITAGKTGTRMSKRRRASDPIVVGQILDGSEAYPADRPVTFFIAWWLDLRVL